MALLKILILLFVAVAFLPIEGFCDDHQNAQEHHCVVACNNCHQMVSPETTMEAFSPEHATYIYSNYVFQYQAPILEQIHRPPIVSI